MSENIQRFISIILIGIYCFISGTLGLIAETESPDFSPIIVSNSATYDPETKLFTAVENVDVYFDGWHLSAPKITYDTVTDRVLVEGPFELAEPDGSSVTYGNFADLSLNKANGIMFAVKHVVEKYLEVNASEVDRDGERFSKFKTVRASTCKVCKAQNTPLWELVATDALHDKRKKTVTYRNAKLLLRGLPVAYTPWVQIPDPSVNRASGFLFPKLSANSALGTQIVIPYFQTIGKSADVTVSPNIVLQPVDSQKTVSNTLETRYRQIFNDGYLEVNGALSSYVGNAKKTRGYLFSNASLSLPNGYKLKFQTQDASDRSYLGTYNFFSEDRYTFSGEPIKFEVDRLDQRIELSNTSANGKVQFSYEHFDPLLSSNHVYGTANSKLNFHWLKSVDLGLMPGALTFSTVAQQYQNDYGPTNIRQHDIDRGSLNISWQHKAQIASKMNLYNDVGVFYDTYNLNDITILKKSQTGSSLYGASKLEWPLNVFKSEQTTTIFTPSVQIVSFDMNGLSLPDADNSTITFRDPFNVSNLSRFERIDRNQDFGHAVSYLTLELPLKTIIRQDYFIGASIVHDEIISADNSYPLSSGYVYKTEFGKLGKWLEFSFSNRFNNEGQPVLTSFSSQVSADPFSFGATYLKREENQIFYSTDEQENWSLDLSLDLAKRTSIQLSTKFDEVDQDQSLTSANFIYDDEINWYLLYNTNFSRFQEKFASRNFELHRRFARGEGTIFYKFSEKLEVSNSYKVGITYKNECINFETALNRYEDVTADRNSIDEVSVSIMLGAFGLENKKRCG